MPTGGGSSCPAASPAGRLVTLRVWWPPEPCFCAPEPRWLARSPPARPGRPAGCSTAPPPGASFALQGRGLAAAAPINLRLGRRGDLRPLCERKIPRRRLLLPRSGRPPLLSPGQIYQLLQLLLAPPRPRGQSPSPSRETRLRGAAEPSPLPWIAKICHPERCSGGGGDTRLRAKAGGNLLTPFQGWFLLPSWAANLQVGAGVISWHYNRPPGSPNG